MSIERHETKFARGLNGSKVVAVLKTRKDIAMPVVMGTLTPELLEVLAQPGPMHRACVFVDAGFWELWADSVTPVFWAAYRDVAFIPVRGSEGCKSLAGLSDVLDALCQFDLDRRQDALFAVGGGAVLDLVGFAASVFRRGVAITKVPTTLMAQVDAGVGLKNAINFGGKKNLVGSFCPPRNAVIDMRFLETLPAREFASGLAEILKVALVLDRELFDVIATLPKLGPDCRRNDQIFLIERAIELMLVQLNANPYESDLKRAVDFGHWIGPLLEMQDTDLLHGEAVAIDMANSLVVSRNRGYLSEAACEDAIAQFERAGLPVAHPLINAAFVRTALEGTVKARGGRQNIPLCTALGAHSFFDNVNCDEVVAANASLSLRAAQAGPVSAVGR